MSAPLAKKPGKPRAAPSHPSFKDMITAAIKALADKKGTSRHAIRKYILANNKVSETAMKTNLNKSLAKMLANNQIAHPKASTGMYKLAKVEAKPGKAKPKTKKTVGAKKRTATKKPKADGGAKKTPSKKSRAKKTTTPAKKAVKKPVKKTVKKKAVKKPAAKKTPKKAAKRPAKKATAAKKK